MAPLGPLILFINKDRASVYFLHSGWDKARWGTGSAEQREWPGAYASSYSTRCLIHAILTLISQISISAEQNPPFFFQFNGTNHWRFPKEAELLRLRIGPVPLDICKYLMEISRKAISSILEKKNKNYPSDRYNSYKCTDELYVRVLVRMCIWVCVCVYIYMF